MPKLNELKPYKSSTAKKKRRGRGDGSGKGSYSGRGMKGQKARSGGSISAGFEGGRMPLIRQIPKARGKGFKGDVREVSEVSLADLATHFGEGEEITKESLVERGLVEETNKVKILGNGDLNGLALKVKDVPVSKGAKESIEKAGGEVINK